jgi:hypothetical protein
MLYIGGSYALAILSDMLAKYRLPPAISSPRVPAAIILDSTPGKAGVQRTSKAFTSQIRNPLMRLIGAFFLYIVYSVYLAYYRYKSRTENPFEFIRRVLLLPSLLPFTSEQTPRLYIFSHKDEIVEFADIEEHIAEARNAGFRVEVEVFEDSHHVSHMRLDPERYWGAVKAFWSSRAYLQPLYSAL